MFILQLSFSDLQKKNILPFKKTRKLFEITYIVRIDWWKVDWRVLPAECGQERVDIPANIPWNQCYCQHSRQYFPVNTPESIFQSIPLVHNSVNTPVHIPVYTPANTQVKLYVVNKPGNTRVNIFQSTL